MTPSRSPILMGHGSVTYEQQKRRRKPIQQKPILSSVLDVLSDDSITSSETDDRNQSQRFKRQKLALSPPAKQPREPSSDFISDSDPESGHQKLGQSSECLVSSTSLTRNDRELSFDTISSFDGDGGRQTRTHLMALPQKKHQILPEPLHTRALRCSRNNMDHELAGQPTDDPECIDGEWLSLPLLYCLHMERHENQPDDLNIHHLRGWPYGEMIIDLAEKDRCTLYEAWQHLMQTRFDIPEADNRQVVDLTKDNDDLTKDRDVIDLTVDD